MPDQKIRILHVVGGMNRGGVETWLMHVLRHIDRKRFHFDFLVHTDKPCAYDKEIHALGGKIIPCLSPHRPWRYAKNFKKILNKHGPYDVVHSHVHHFSGFVLRQAQKAGVPKRIAHSHSNTAVNDESGGIFRSAYLRLTASWIQRHATSGISCSQNSAASLFGGLWQNDSRWRVIHCGIDLKPFNDLEPGNFARNELGIMQDALVVGHVGSFTKVKNHEFLVDIFSEISSREPKAILLLVGDGPLYRRIKEKIVRYGLSRKTVFAGSRKDVPRLMIEAMDIFVLPSLLEGLPLALIEAQAASLPIVFSDTITDEADIIPPLIHRLSVEQPASAWADRVIAEAKKVRMPNHNTTQVRGRFPFDILFSQEQLRQVYEV